MQIRDRTEKQIDLQREQIEINLVKKERKKEKRKKNTKEREKLVGV